MKGGIINIVLLFLFISVIGILFFIVNDKFDPKDYIKESNVRKEEQLQKIKGVDFLEQYASEFTEHINKCFDEGVSSNSKHFRLPKFVLTTNKDNVKFNYTKVMNETENILDVRGYNGDDVEVFACIINKEPEDKKYTVEDIYYTSIGE